MDVHGDGVELFEAGHSSHQKDNDTPAFNSLYCSAEQIGSDGLEILKDQHLVGISQNFVGFFVVAVPDLVAADKQIKRIIYTLVVQPLHLHIFDVFHPFFLVA